MYFDSLYPFIVYYLTNDNLKCLIEKVEFKRAFFLVDYGIFIFSCIFSILIPSQIITYILNTLFLTNTSIFIDVSHAFILATYTNIIVPEKILEPIEEYFKIEFCDQYDYDDYIENVQKGNIKEIMKELYETIIKSPILEELFFRGILYWTLRYIGIPSVFLIILVSLFFSFIHFDTDKNYDQNLDTLIETFCFSLIVTTYFDITKNLRVCILCHFFDNLVCILYWTKDALYTKEEEEEEEEEENEEEE